MGLVWPQGNASYSRTTTPKNQEKLSIMEIFNIIRSCSTHIDLARFDLSSRHLWLAACCLLLPWLFEEPAASGVSRNIPRCIELYWEFSIELSPFHVFQAISCYCRFILMNHLCTVVIQLGSATIVGRQFSMPCWSLFCSSLHYILFFHYTFAIFLLEIHSFHFC